VHRLVRQEEKNPFAQQRKENQGNNKLKHHFSPKLTAAKGQQFYILMNH